MGFQVVADYDAINDIVKKINNTNSDYKALVDRLSGEYSSVLNSEDWSGIDAKTFKSKYEYFLSSLNQISNIYSEMSNTILEVSKRYQEVDEQYGKITLNNNYVMSQDLIVDDYVAEETTQPPVDDFDSLEVVPTQSEEDKIADKIDSRWESNNNNQNKYNSNSKNKYNNKNDKKHYGGGN